MKTLLLAVALLALVTPAQAWRNQPGWDLPDYGPTWGGNPPGAAVYPPAGYRYRRMPPVGSYLPPPGYLAPPTPGPSSIPPPRVYSRPQAVPLPQGEGREQTKRRLFDEMNSYCAKWPDDGACNGERK